MGVTVQKMITYPTQLRADPGNEDRTRYSGSVIMVGMGGVAAEVFRDRALAMPPLNESLARRALESLKSWAPVARLPRQAGGKHRPAHRDPDAILVPRGRLPGNH